MVTNDKEQQRTTLVVGLGVTGLSVVRHLHGQGSCVSVADVAERPHALAALRALNPNIEFRSGEFDSAWFAKFDTLVVSPGISLATAAIVAARTAGAEIIGDIEMYARTSDVPVIAVTGSNGKSTVTALTGEILAHAGLNVAVGGNIGTAALDLVESPAVADIHVLELSSFQLETTSSLNPRVACVLNVAADHLDRYADIEQYVDAKRRIFLGAEAAILNRDDTRVAAFAAALADRRIRSFGNSRPTTTEDYGIAERDGRQWIVRGARELVAVDALTLIGQHNALNVMAALALAESAGVDPAVGIEAAVNFRGLAHRTEVVGEWSGVRWINDSKGTNVGATVAAVYGVDAPLVLIAGGMAKEPQFDLLATALTGRAHCVVLFGRDADELAKAMSGLNVVRAEDLDDAIARAAAAAVSGDTVLFSPACASFDMFSNFAERGDTFRHLVQARFNQ